MKLLIQKVKDLKIRNKEIILDLSQEEFCLLVYVGIEKGDEKKNLEEIVKEVEKLEILDEMTQMNNGRINANDNELSRINYSHKFDQNSRKFVNKKFQFSISEVKPKIVFVSQITLLAGFEKGRINFNQSLDFNLAKKIFDEFILTWQKLGYNVYKSEFGSYLEIESTNLGPVNFYLDL